METDERELTLSDLMSIVAHRWKIIFLPALIGAIAAALIIYLQPKTYESYALLKIGNRGGTPFETVASLNVVMDSQPMMEALRNQIYGKDAEWANKAAFVNIYYNEVAGMLRISARNPKPEIAAAYVRAATDLVFERHQKLYAAHLQELGSLIEFVKSVIKPIPLSSGMNDFRVEPTRIEINAVIPTTPLPSGASKKVFAVFAVLCILDAIVAFYIEGKGAVR